MSARATTEDDRETIRSQAVAAQVDVGIVDLEQRNPLATIKKIVLESAAFRYPTAARAELAQAEVREFFRRAGRLFDEGKDYDAVRLASQLVARLRLLQSPARLENEAPEPGSFEHRDRLVRAMAGDGWSRQAATGAGLYAINRLSHVEGERRVLVRFGGGEDEDSPRWAEFEVETGGRKTLRRLTEAELHALNASVLVNQNVMGNVLRSTGKRRGQ